MKFSEQLQRYAELIIRHGLNVQPGQLVNIGAEPIHREFAMLLVEQAYKCGAKFVHVMLGDPEAERLRLLYGPKDALDFVPPYLVTQYDYLLDQRAASVRVLGARDPDVLSDLPPEPINKMRVAQRQAMKRYFEEGIGQSLVHWSVVAAATPAWGKKVFPKLSEDAACTALWEQIFKICRADRPNCLELWRAHNTKLKARAQELNGTKIKTLKFTGPGTDLEVRLSPKARFAGGSEPGPHGVEFEPNLPTEEVFTTPDWRGTEGTVTTTRPFLVNGKMVKGLTLRFKDGEIVEFDAVEGKETFAAYINSDPGAKRLGEVALVGIDSPIYQSGLIFEEILFDENAACHIAIGSAYKFCIQGSAQMSPQELDALGCNESCVHTDMMISSDKVDVTAVTYDGQSRPLIKSGAWV